MMVFPIIQELEQNGYLKVLVRAGMVSTKVMYHYEIYLEFDKRKKTTKKKTEDIVSDLQEDFHVGRSTVYNIIKTFK